MGIVEALKALCKKMTGQQSAGTSVAEVVEEIADHYTPPSAGAKGEKGDPGIGIKTIAGSIDGSNKLTLKITLTDDSVQTVEGSITPSV